MTWLKLPALSLFALTASGCIIEHHASGWASDEGELTVEWTLDDSFDPRACRDFGARTVELLVHDWDGELVADVQAHCDDFSLTIDLADGTYSIDVTLLDGSGRTASTTLPLDDVDVYAGDETFIPVDFPVDSLR